MIVRDEGRIMNGSAVIVNGVHFSEFGAHLADFHQQAGGKRSEVM